ncbi:hypothetical protein Fot_03739 [Forsythia ovata]|uniref:Uncharacterized protein n=1 Tax=Forsythia ovata TaxID=205694 RepID=A0ABD1XBF8_9LAMI
MKGKRFKERFVEVFHCFLNQHKIVVGKESNQSFTKKELKVVLGRSRTNQARCASTRSGGARAFTTKVFYSTTVHDITRSNVYHSNDVAKSDFFSTSSSGDSAC